MTNKPDTNEPDTTDHTAREAGPRPEHPHGEVGDKQRNTSASNPSEASPPRKPSSPTRNPEQPPAQSSQKPQSHESVTHSPQPGEIDALENGSDRSGLAPNSGESRPDDTGSTEHREDPDRARGAQHGTPGMSYPPTPPYGYAIHGGAALPYHQYHANPPGVVPQPASGVSQPADPPFPQPTLPPFAQPLTPVPLPPFFTPALGSQPEGVHTSPYGYAQAQFNPYTHFPNWTAPLPPPRYPSPPIPDVSNNLSQDNTRIIAHRFAGFLFNIRTDAKVASKKLRVKPVNNHVEYYCSGVLLTKIKYKLERDIFSLYEEDGTEPLRDAKLCEKIEILVGPIVAGLFEDPWNPKDFKFAWGIRDCEGIGDGNSFHIDVLRDVDGVVQHDSPSRQLQQSSPAGRRPIVAEMDAFHRIPSVEGTGHLSRTPYVQHSIDRTHLLNVLREIELLTAMELAKRSFLTGPAVASVIGRKDQALLVESQMYRTFSTEVPTLFGLFVSKVSSWSKKLSDLASKLGSRLRFKRRYGDEEEPLGSLVPHDKESSTPDTENVVSPTGLSAPYPVLGHSLLPVDGGVESQDEDNTTLDGYSQASGDDVIAWWAGLSSDDEDRGGPDRQPQASVDGTWWKAGSSSEDGDFGGSEGQSHASGDEAIAQYNTGPSSEGDDEGGSDRQFPAPSGDSNAHLGNSAGDLLIGADANHTEKIPTYLHLSFNVEVSGSEKEELLESQERETKGEKVEGDDDFHLEAEGHTNSRQEKAPNSVNSNSHASPAHAPDKQSQGEYQSEYEKKMEGLTVQHPEEPDNSLSAIAEKFIRKSQENRQTEERRLRTRDSRNEESPHGDKIPAHESDDVHHEEPSTLPQPHGDEPNPGKKVRFTVPSSEQSVPDGDNGGAKLEDQRLRNEFEEARRANIRASYPSNSLRDNALAYSYNSPAYPVYSYQPPNPSRQSSTHSQSVAPSVVEPYQEAVAAGQIYDVPAHTLDELAKPEDFLPSIPEGQLNVDGSHNHDVHPTSWNPPPPLISSDTVALPRPATSSKPFRRFSRKSSRMTTYDGDTSTESTYMSDDQRRRNRMPLLIGKDALSVTLGVVIVILSILAVAFDPAGEENWFKRVEEGVFVMFSLGVPLLLAMRSRLTHNLKPRMPNVKRKVRSMRDLEKLNKTTDGADFMKQLQRELLFNEELSKLFSPRNACYKLSRMSGHLVVSEQAQYRKVFRDVWFFGEEHAYNKILGRAFRYQQKDNVLMIENESVDIEGVIVHVRRRRGKYAFGSSLEK